MCENHFGDSSLIPIFLLWVLDQLRSSVLFFSVRFHLQNKKCWVTDVSSTLAYYNAKSRENLVHVDQILDISTIYLNP